MKKYKYIFWDLDGTISNTSEGVYNCINYGLEPYGIHIERDNIRPFIGPPLRLSLPKFAGLDQEYVEAAIARYRERYIPIGVYECEIFPSVKDTMEAFRNAGYIQVLTSSKPEAQCHDVLKKFELEDLLDEIVGASLDGKIDTKIEVLNEAFRRLEMANPEFSKNDVVLIGDTMYDADGANEGGIDCIGITYGFGTREELMEHGVIAVYDELESLRADIMEA